MKKAICLLIPTLMLGACAAPKVLTQSEILGARSLQVIYEQTGAVGTGNKNKSTKGLYNYSIRICDFDDQGTLQNCSETVALQNVSRQAIK